MNINSTNDLANQSSGKEVTYLKSGLLGFLGPVSTAMTFTRSV